MKFNVPSLPTMFLAVAWVLWVQSRLNGHCSSPHFKVMTVFGDSYSDTGNTYVLSNKIWPPSWYFHGRFSNGKVWSEHVVEKKNYKLQTYAFGGATSDSNLVQGYSGQDGTLEVPGFIQQVQRYLSNHPRHHHGTPVYDELFVINFQGNDFGFSPFQNPREVVDRLKEGLETLVRNAGARHILVIENVNYGLLPYFVKNATLTELYSSTALKQSIEYQESFKASLRAKYGSAKRHQHPFESCRTKDKNTVDQVRIGYLSMAEIYKDLYQPESLKRLGISDVTHGCVSNDGKTQCIRLLDLYPCHSFPHCFFRRVTTSALSSPTATRAIDRKSVEPSSIVDDHSFSKGKPSLSRFRRIKRRLFWDDPQDMTDLQPHIDESLVSKKEIWGSMLFGVGFYTYNNTCQSLLLPILMQGVARGASRLESNWEIPCPDDDSDIPAGDRCLVPFGWIRVTPTSYVLLAGVLLTWCSIAVSLGVSAIADHGRRAKKMTLFATWTLCAINAFMFMGALWPSIWWFCGLNYVVAGIMNGVIQNFYDAMIPNLTKYHPAVIRAMVEYGDNSDEFTIAKTKVQTFLSGGASASGYVSGLFLTVVTAMILLFVGQTLLIVGYCVVMVSGYIALVTCLFAKFSVQRTFPPLPTGANKFTFGYRRIGKTVAKARKLKTLFYFLCGWFILGDGLSAVSSMAILIAQADLQLGNAVLITAALIQFVTAGLGMIFWIWMQNSRGMAPKKVVILNTFLFGLLPCYCLLALIPGCPIGLQHEWELYMLAVFFGFLQGAIYSSNRVVYAQFIPKGHENELFALYEISSSASSWIAPLVCTAIIESSSTRKTWIFLATQFFIPAVMLIFVDVDKGRSEALAFYEAEQAEESRVEDETSLTEVVSSGPESVHDVHDVHEE